MSTTTVSVLRVRELLIWVAVILFVLAAIIAQGYLGGLSVDWGVLVAAGLACFAASTSRRFG